MNSKIKNLGLAALLATTAVGCANKPGNLMVSKIGLAGHLNQEYLNEVGSSVSKQLCAEDNKFLKQNYEVKTPGKKVSKVDENGNVQEITGEPVISYNIEQCLEDVKRSTINHYSKKIMTVYAAINTNTGRYDSTLKGSLGGSIPSPNMWTMPGVTDKDRIAEATRIASTMPNSVLSAINVKNYEVQADHKIAANKTRDNWNDIRAAAIDLAIIGYHSGSSAAPSDISDVVDPRFGNGSGGKIIIKALGGN